MSTRKSKASKLLEDLAGGPLTLGSYVQSIREGEGLSQVAFARKLGISRSHLCDIEKGRKPVSAAKAAKMARKLGYSEKQFVLLALQDSMTRAGLDYQISISGG
jgi:transcriptional regulator with XRE-family HTH domain